MNRGTEDLGFMDWVHFLQPGEPALVLFSSEWKFSVLLNMGAVKKRCQDFGKPIEI